MKPFSEVLAADFVAIDVELVEDDLVHGPPHSGATLAVELLRVTEQLERQCEELAPSVDLACCVGELIVDLSPLDLDGCNLLLDLGAWPRGVIQELHVAIFRGVQLGQAALQTLAQRVHAAKLI
ncbi:hypothetical protein [Amycolatopsis sp. NBC_01480]|uniref:hypothetical protein n=1 Tax=Amycolatopsis sp. NBC_01480 TaxID=2903562 RepID=UPI002E2A6829|nr:hypothetical protein [Amycolatopsis sp. NBC_01480]